MFQMLAVQIEVILLLLLCRATTPTVIGISGLNFPDHKFGLEHYQYLINW